jgi:hypothetical protein
LSPAVPAGSAGLMPQREGDDPPPPPPRPPIGGIWPTGISRQLWPCGLKDGLIGRLSIEVVLSYPFEVIGGRVACRVGRPLFATETPAWASSKPQGAVIWRHHRRRVATGLSGTLIAFLPGLGDLVGGSDPTASGRPRIQIAFGGTA